MPAKIEYPFTLEKIRGLKLGETVSLSGRIFTGRDRLHKYLFDGGKCPVSLKDGAMFHCGPAVLRKDRTWITQAVGPTTSMREEIYMPRLIEQQGIRVIIGKGGMGPQTQKACAAFGCVYLEAVGGAAQVLNEKVSGVANVRFKNEFGTTDALWELNVTEFPAIVAIDAKGRSLHKKVQISSKRMLGKIFKKASPFKG